MKRIKCITILLVTVILFIIVIPIIINEAYKYGSLYGGYVIEWDAADTLSYYGTLLGTSITITVLVATISFTKKQIQHDRFLEHNYAKWEKIEAVITQALTSVSPLNINDFGKIENADFQTLLAMLGHLQSYEAAVKASLDTIKCHVSPHDHPQMTVFEKKLTEYISRFCEVERELKENISKLMAVAAVSQGSVPFPVLYMNNAELNGIIMKISSAHDGPFQELLSMKREVFEKIYVDIEQQAEEILQFKKRKKNNHAHT